MDMKLIVMVVILADVKGVLLSVIYIVLLEIK